jgi:hypothetical protein
LVHLKIEDDELDVEELDVEYEDGDFAKYNGEIPPDGTVLNGQVAKMWWTYSGDGTAMLKVLVIADEDTSGEYAGLPCWENFVLKPTAAFKYQPFLHHFGLTVADVKKKTYVAENDDKNGAPIEKIGKFKPGSDDALCAFIVSREKYDGKWSAHVGEWLEYDPDREPPEVEDEEEEEEVARPARGRKPASKKPAAKAPVRGRRPAEAEEEEEEADEEEAEDTEEAEEEDAEEEETPPARGNRRAPAKTASKAPARKAVPAKAPAKGRRPAARKPARGSSDDAPF